MESYADIRYNYSASLPTRAKIQVNTRNKSVGFDLFLCLLYFVADIYHGKCIMDVQVWLEESGFSEYKAKFIGMFACLVLLE